jgi:hypothetical protein
MLLIFGRRGTREILLWLTMTILWVGVLLAIVAAFHTPPGINHLPPRITRR